MKNILKTISLLMALLMILGVLASCAKKNNVTSSTSATDSNTENNTEGSNGTEPENGTVESQESESSGVTSDESDTEAISSPEAGYTNQNLVEFANGLAENVNSYFENASREHYIMENSNMTLKYSLKSDSKQYVSGLYNKEGKPYIQNTMDVYYKKKDGTVSYSSNSTVNTQPNVYRFGYYYYENRLEGEVLMSDGYTDFNLVPFDIKDMAYSDQVNTSFKNDTLTVAVLDSADPRFAYNVVSTDCNFLKITVKADLSQSSKDTITIFVKLDENAKGFSSELQVTFKIINDGEYHTYYVPFSTLDGFEGKIYGIRVDPNGNKGDKYQFTDIAYSKVSTGELSLARAVLVYSDKMHQILQFNATSEVNDIAELGMITKVSADTVAKLVVKDKNGIQDSIDKVNWASAEYIGFDIKDVGIFGYILPDDKLSGKMEVTLEDGMYVIRQYATPRGYVIYPSVEGTNNGNDYFMGQRIYTDDSHDFAEFLHEAYCERNPLTSKNIIVNTECSEEGTFLGYDPLRGIYKFGVKAIGFLGAFSTYPNRHFSVNFNIVGDDVNRKFYVMTTNTTQGCIECAVVLNDKNMVLPIPVEVGKNFKGDGEANIYNIDDWMYCEAIIPMIALKGSSQEFTILNLYQKWGKYDLKQISWIQFYCPFYHLSTGTTETNCIRQMFDTKGNRELMYLPDHRAWSAPFWHEMNIGNNQPQHTNGGHHYFIQYTDADGKYNSIEFVNDTITSYGPTYAEIKMDYITDDRKMEVYHTHMEMPQNDENRTYYTIEYKVLEDISINEFKQNFSIYSVRDKNTGGYYRNIGYLDKDNNYAVADSIAQTKEVKDGTQQCFELGNIAPYFSFFYVPDYVPADGIPGYVNLSFIIANTEITINGEKYEPKFLLYNEKVDGNVYLRLTLDLGDVTLKAGDTFKMNAIIMPWGSEELNPPKNEKDRDPNKVYYDTIIDGVAYNDKNVRDVRENSVLKPFVGTAGKDTEVVESAFMPMFRTTNGKSAEFTISGGENNVTTRVFGFDTLTVPKIEELVNGEWVDYDVCSINAPDDKGYAHLYDGYMVQYDADGTYSYSFVTTITKGEARTFRIVADGEFEGFPDEVIVKNDCYYEGEEYKYFWEAADLEESALDKLVNFGTVSLEGNYVSFFGNGGYAEAYINPLSQGYRSSGKYLAIKYRFPNSNKTIAPSSIEIFVSTKNDSPASEDGLYAKVIADGEWHVLVIDLEKTKPNTFVAAEDGKFYAKYLRIDVLNQVTPATDCIDLEYAAMFENLYNAVMFDDSVEYVTYIEGAITKNLDSTTGEEYVVKYNKNENYHDSEVYHATCLEALNGKQLAGGLGGNLLKGPELLALNSTTLNETLLFISGWTVVEGGFEKIVWSADGGVTWNDASFYRLSKFGNGSPDHIKVAEGRLNNSYTFVEREASYTGITYQGKRLPYYHEECAGVAADLTAYIGQTVNVTFAAIPKSDPNGLCYIAHITNVQSVEPGATDNDNEEEVLNDEYNDVSSGYVKSKIVHSTCLDGVNGLKLAGGMGGNSNKGPEIIAINSTTIGGSKVVISGWTVVEGGFDRIVWSADGGKTWQTAALYQRDSFGNGSATHIEVSEGRLNNSYTFADINNSVAGCTYQGTLSTSGYNANTHGVAADLTQYIGQTVNVTFAAVPKGQPNSLCYIAHLTGVQVTE